MDQPKIERMLRLMMMLTSNCNHSIEDIAERLDMSKRTVYRYISTFRDSGFVIKKQDEIFRIDKTSPYFKEISQLVHFTEEEAYILKKAIESIDENNLLKQNLKKKLYSVYDYKFIADVVIQPKNKENIHHIITAIEQKKQLVLNDYHSANSNSIRSRIVEPFALTTNYVQLWAYEIEAQKNKLFKVSRINSTTVLDTRMRYEHLHKSDFMDIFRISGQKRIPVLLKLNIRAANLLKEEYPLAEQFLKKTDENHWFLQTEVSSFEGIGRFILGLFDDIEIIENNKLKQYIKNKILTMRRKEIISKKNR
jgi:predicted DNA-binding transcriptional regulator YafY